MPRRRGASASPFDAAGFAGGVFRAPGVAGRRLACGRNQKGAVWVAPTDASLIVRVTVGGLARRLGAVGREPMRDRLSPAHC
jgi:hypothetical protein